MRFKAEETPGESRVRSALVNIIKDGVACRATGILTGGAFFVAFPMTVVKNITGRIFSNGKEKTG